MNWSELVRAYPVLETIEAEILDYRRAGVAWQDAFSAVSEKVVRALGKFSAEFYHLARRRLLHVYQQAEQQPAGQPSPD
jgi:hypothetical protein